MKVIVIQNIENLCLKLWNQRAYLSFALSYPNIRREIQDVSRALTQTLPIHVSIRIADMHHKGGHWGIPRENEGTERDIRGVGWDMSIPLKLFLVLSGNGSLFPQTSA